MKIQDIPLGVLVIVIGCYAIYAAELISKLTSKIDFLIMMILILLSNFLFKIGLKLIYGFEIKKDKL